VLRKKQGSQIHKELGILSLHAPHPSSRLVFAISSTTTIAAMNDTLSLWQLIWHASWMVQAVMLLLLLASIASWALIFQKFTQIRHTRARNRVFEDAFWSGHSLAELHTAATRNTHEAGAQERIFLAAMREVQKLRERRVQDSSVILDGANRAMRATLQRELDDLEEGLPLLASVGSVSPYIGLFGTVWGIMSTFTKFGTASQMTLATVAPSIAEALIATAFGLLAAIPAVLAYNRYARESDKTAMQLEGFIDEFSNILQRQLLPAPALAPNTATPTPATVQQAGAGLR
jgi:biopolymer transport protein TolQ